MLISRPAKVNDFHIARERLVPALTIPGGLAVALLQDRTGNVARLVKVTTLLIAKNLSLVLYLLKKTVKFNNNMIGHYVYLICQVVCQMVYLRLGTAYHQSQPLSSCA